MMTTKSILTVEIILEVLQDDHELDILSEIDTYAEPEAAVDEGIIKQNLSTKTLQ